MKPDADPSLRRAIAPEIEAELRARRARLGRRAPARGERPIVARVIVARRGAVLLGVPIERAAAFRRLLLTPLPGVPPAIAGLFQIRGYTHCCVDLLPILTGARASAPTEAEAVLVGVLETPNGPLGLRFDEILGPRDVHRDEIDDGLQHSCGSIMAMVTHDLLEIIDVHRLCESPEIRVVGSALDR